MRTLKTSGGGNATGARDASGSTRTNKRPGGGYNQATAGNRKAASQAKAKKKGR